MLRLYDRNIDFQVDISAKIRRTANYAGFSGFGINQYGGNPPLKASNNRMDGNCSPGRPNLAHRRCGWGKR